MSDAVSMSDPDILTKLTGAISGGNTQFLNEGGTLLSGLLGGGGLSTLTGALSQFSGAPQPATQALLGTITHATVGTIGQQDPSNWSDPSAILSMLNSQKSAISAALPPELSRALGASGLLAGLGLRHHRLSIDWARVEPEPGRHDPAAIARITCPIGLPGITGKEPAVIAVAVAAALLPRLTGADRVQVPT